MTQGRGTYTMQVSHYDPVPAHLQQKIVEEHKKEVDGLSILTPRAARASVRAAEEVDCRGPVVVAGASQPA